jgi:ABC-type branched-subunit amino acid transport system substrate-binding protein
MTRKDQYQELADPVKIGCLFDNPPRTTDHAERVYDLVAAQLKASGRFDRGIEFVKVYPWGPPAGSIQASIDAYHQLCDMGCVAVIGFNHADDSIAIGPYADARKVPVIGLGATAHGMTDWSFSICWSSIPHDVYTMASWLKQNGHKRVVVTWDRADHALENIEHFRNAAARAGIRILADERFPQLLVPRLPEIFERTVGEFRALKPDALAHFGTSPVSGRWADFVGKSGWDIPRIMNDAFFGASIPESRSHYEGWVGTTMWDDDNKVLAKFYDEYTAAYPGIPFASPEMIALYRDGVSALIEGVILAPTLTPDGVRRGLEQVQLLPAASGGPRTCISFSPYAHRGNQGADVMVLRRVKDGQLIMEGHIELF